MTYNILIVSQTSIPAPPYSIKSLPNANRIDIIIRAILASFEGSLEAPMQIQVFFSKSNFLLTVKKEDIHNKIQFMTELKVGEQLLHTLRVCQQKIRGQHVGFKIQENITFQTIIDQYFQNDWDLVLLESNGMSYQQFFEKKQKQKKVYIIGARDDLNQEQQEFLANKQIKKLSLGEKQYLASQVITLLRFFHTCS